MNDFLVWFTTGIWHILDIKGYDHILFIMALVCVYKISEWRKILVAITAFTVGHCLTLALSTLNIISINSNLVEFLIPLTIAFTCLVNLTKRNQSTNLPVVLLTISFGLIHGLGFSYLLRTMLGNTKSILLPLFSFNIGIECGQLIIAVGALILSWIWSNILEFNPKYYSKLLSTAILIVALLLAVTRFVSLHPN